MIVDYGELRFRIGALDVPIMELKLGNSKTMLNIGVALDDKFRHFDSTLIADALRKMAEKLDEQP